MFVSLNYDSNKNIAFKFRTQINRNANITETSPTDISNDGIIFNSRLKEKKHNNNKVNKQNKKYYIK